MRPVVGQRHDVVIVFVQQRLVAHGTSLSFVGALREPRRTEPTSSAITAIGITHQAATPPSASAAVTPIAAATPAAISQSSPKMNAYQKRANASTRLMRRLLCLPARGRR